MSDSNQMETIATRLTDVQVVDWGTEELRAGDPDDARVLANLRVIQAIDEIHRRNHSGDEDPNVPFRMWGMLRLISPIGEGSYGEVFKAWDSSLGREVALKLFRTTSEGDSSPLRDEELLQEARNLARLNHENIVQVYGAETNNGRAGFWMEYVVGETLGDALTSRGELDAIEAAHIGTKLCRALAAAHSAEILHRDIKADNVLRSAGGRYYLMDFGAGASIEDTLLQVPQRAGTPIYMAPEVLFEGRTTVQSDIYSLGVLLFHSVTLLFPVSSPDYPTLVELHKAKKAKRLAETKSGLPPQFVQVVDRCLNPDPKKRFSTAAELESALSETLTGSAPAASHSRTNAALLALLVVVLLMQVPWNRILPQPGSSIRSVAVLALENNSLDQSASEHMGRGLGQHLVTQLGYLPDLRVTPWSTSKRANTEGLPLETIAKDLEVDALVLGSYTLSNGRISGTISLVDPHEDTQLFSEAFESSRDDLLNLQSRLGITVANRLRSSLNGDERELIAAPAAASLEAYELCLKGDGALQESTEEATTRALSFYRRAADRDPSLVEAHNGIGAVHSARFFYGWEGGAANLALAEASYLRAKELEPSSFTATHGLIQGHFEQYHMAEALNVAEEFSKVARSDFERHFCWGIAYTLSGFANLAVPELQNALAIDPSSPGANWFLVLALAWHGADDETLEAWENFFLRYGEDPELQTWIGLLYLKRGQCDDAMIHLDRAVDLFGQDSNIYTRYYALRAREQCVPDARDHRLRYLALKSELEDQLARYPDNFRVRGVLAAVCASLLDEEGVRLHYSALPIDHKVDSAVFWPGLRDELIAMVEEMPWDMVYLRFRFKGLGGTDSKPLDVAFEELGERHRLESDRRRRARSS